MLRESLPNSSENITVEKERKIGLTIIKNIGVSLSDIPINLGLNPGHKDIDWDFINKQIEIKNYLQNNELNTAKGDSSAKEILSRHGITRENFRDFFNDEFTASNLMAAYEVTHSIAAKENDGQDIDHQSYAA